MKTYTNNSNNNPVNINSLKTTTMKTQVNNVKLNNVKPTNVKMNIRKAAAAFATVLATVLTLATAPMTLAASGPGPEASTLQSAVFQLPNSLKFKTVIAPADSKLSVVIRNQKNEAIYSEAMKHNQGYIRTFDLGTLPDGEYTFEISNGQQTQSQTFKIETTSARVVNVN
jgi:hypothetical protein